MTGAHAMSRRYSIGEEVCNSISHGIGTMLSIYGLLIMLQVSILQKDPYKIFASIVFGSSLILLYGMSTLYHTVNNERVKNILQVFDHCSIFVLIAGTYTPFTTIVLKGKTGVVLGAFIWISAIVGIILNIIDLKKYKKLSMFCYIAMGWAIVFAFPQLATAFNMKGIVLMIIGGVMYTGGTLFYKRKGVEYMHAIWHIFVLLGSIFHFIAIYNYIIKI